MARKTVICTSFLRFSGGISGWAQEAAVSSWDGESSASQASRGKRSDANCASCHSEDLSGGEARRSSDLSF